MHHYQIGPASNGPSDSCHYKRLLSSFAVAGTRRSLVTWLTVDVACHLWYKTADGTNAVCVVLRYEPEVELWRTCDHI